MTDHEALNFRAHARGDDELYRAANVIVHLLPTDLALLFRRSARAETDIEHYQRLVEALDAIVEKAKTEVDNEGLRSGRFARTEVAISFPSALNDTSEAR